MAITKTDALATIAFVTLEAHGKGYNPSLHDVAVAVTRATWQLELTTPETVAFIDEAITSLARRHNWRGEDWTSILGDNVVIIPRRAHPSS